MRLSVANDGRVYVSICGISGKWQQRIRSHTGFVFVPHLVSFPSLLCLGPVDWTELRVPKRAKPHGTHHHPDSSLQSNGTKAVYTGPLGEPQCEEPVSCVKWCHASTQTEAVRASDGSLVNPCSG